MILVAIRIEVVVDDAGEGEVARPRTDEWIRVLRTHSGPKHERGIGCVLSVGRPKASDVDGRGGTSSVQASDVGSTHTVSVGPL